MRGFRFRPKTCQPPTNEASRRTRKTKLRGTNNILLMRKRNHGFLLLAIAPT